MDTLRDRRYVSRYQGADGERVELMGAAFGTSSGHVHSTSGFPDGSPIPGGRFVIDSPRMITGDQRIFQGRQNRMVCLPDRDGKYLKHLDGVTDFSDMIDSVKDADGLFRFIGVSGYGGNTCKKQCRVHPCCPIGYEDIADRGNYWPLLGDATDIITQGYVWVYAEKPILVTDDLHVRTAPIDKDAIPCQLIGGVTSVPDSGTHPIGSNVRIEAIARAGNAVLLELGGMSNK